MDGNYKLGKEAVLLDMLIETHRVEIKKSSSYSYANQKTKGWGKLDPISQRIFLEMGFDRKNLRKGQPNILKQSLEAQMGSQMRSNLNNSFKGESLSCSTGMCSSIKAGTILSHPGHHDLNNLSPYFTSSAPLKTHSQANQLLRSNFHADNETGYDE